MNDFIKAQRAGQGEFLTASEAGVCGYGGSSYRIQPEHRFRNLAPSIREAVPAYFSAKGIQWHTHSNHGLSSQVCCLNFLAPLAHHPELLAHFVQSILGGSQPKMLPVESGPDGLPWYVGFEWIGGDYLNEGGKSGLRTRGANATSADAVLMCERNGRRETLLIEWKYTESYGTPISPSGNATRLKRYENFVFYPGGPIRADLSLKVEDFFWEPFYQLLRQQMLAFQMEQVREDGAEIVRVLHISPTGNRALKVVTAPALRAHGSDLASAWPALLKMPDRFASVNVAQAFAPLLLEPGAAADWAEYVSGRYSSILVA